MLNYAKIAQKNKQKKAQKYKYEQNIMYTS